jgi:hypothetical protein
LAHSHAPSSSQNGHCGEGEVRWRKLTLMTTTAAPVELQQVLVAGHFAGRETAGAASRRDLT